MTDSVRIKVKDPKHVWEMAEAGGLMTAVEKLEALPATLKQTPGMALAIATMTAEANFHRGAVSSKNLMAIARAGYDISRYKSVHFDPNTSELICEFYEPDLFNSAPEDSE